MRACRAGRYDEVRRLVEAGANVETDASGFTPLQWACHEGHLEVVKVLLACGADIERISTFSDTPLTLACRKEHIQIMQVLLANKADVNAANSFGHTPLVIAKTRQTMELLIAHGADIDIKDRLGRTPLHWACYHADFSKVQFLLDNGADMNCQDTSRRWTPLMNACWAGSVEIVKLLLDRGARADFKGRFKETALSIAKKGTKSDFHPSQSREIVALLKSKSKRSWF